MIINKHPAVTLSAAVGKPDAYAGELPVVFVQLKPGAEATPEELMVFLEKNISERSALPKEVIISNAILLTAVGKIFKPQLRWYLTKREISNLHEPLRGKGIAFEVVVKEDKQ